MAQKIIQVGLAGFGMSGQIFHAPFIHAHEHFNLKKVFERSTEKSKLEYPYVEVVKTFEGLLTEDIDLIVISTPNNFHFSMAKQALEAGKNVIVEKPMAITVSEGETLCQLAKEKGLLLSVYQSRRFDSDFLTVKNIIETDQLGEIYDYEVHYDRYVTKPSAKKWKANGGKGINILYDLGVHIIDQVYTLFGMPDEVYADFRKQRPTTYEFDNFEVTLYYDQKKVTLTAGESVIYQGPRYKIGGSKGAFVKYGLDVQEAALVAGERPPSDHWGVETEENHGTLFYPEGDQILEKRLPSYKGNYGNYYTNIYEALSDPNALYVKPEQAVDVLKIITAAEESNLLKKRVSMIS